MSDLRLLPALQRETIIIEMAKALRGMHFDVTMKAQLRQLFGQERFDVFGAEAIRRERIRAQLFPVKERECA